MTRYLLLPVVVVALMVGGAAALAQEETAPAQEETAPVRLDPHGSAEACESCHVPGPTPGEPGVPLPSMQACSVCHPDAVEDMHAVGLRPDQSTVPPGWPLEDGLVSCATCHAEPACAPDRPRDPPYHRGGPYANPDAMCWQCHDDASFERTDPHHPDESRSASDGSCGGCHAGIPEEGASFADSKLRAEEKVCELCHEDTPHLGVESHVGKKVESMDESARSVLSLDPEGLVACWTCHEVHAEGHSGLKPKDRALPDALRTEVLQSDWTAEVPEESRWPGVEREHPPMLALPLEGGALCRACHGVGP